MEDEAEMPSMQQKYHDYTLEFAVELRSLYTGKRKAFLSKQLYDSILRAFLSTTEILRTGKVSLRLRGGRRWQSTMSTRVHQENNA